ncbi:hypothetical protein [Flammeovirga pacifica]|uniref:Cytochrome c domain-containing protein n=1 Tax=Flammeovirga pacifica TaxID=915059 RepID=A0A1S1YTP7_FLAPC|nr:hypothetical protein [Flammeovirga pacifica]OHX64400.1 hypothetical protein NH26_22675 [Flammeovirga pacifica]
MINHKFTLSLLASLFLFIAAFKTAGSGKEVNTEEVISYNGTIKRIIKNNCIVCHSGKRPSGDLLLTNYERVVEAVKTKDVLKRINDPNDPMPIYGMMPEKERKAIQQWAENGFELEIKNKEEKEDSIKNMDNYAFNVPDIKAVDINNNGFEFLEKMQGHWVGKIFLLGQDIPWFAFDFRAINSSQIHGLFEGGSMGNLFNTFFVADYKGKTTIMLRNGGILGGIYRTSYFVLTSVKDDTYVFEDAYGGKQIMWVEVSFKNDSMKMLTYTSKMGLKEPSKHIEFEGKRMHSDLAVKAAKSYGFPKKDIVKSFPNGMPLPNWGEEYPVITSASYLMESEDYNYALLGKLAEDPIQISDIQNIASIQLEFSRKDLSKGKNIQVYLSRTPLTDKKGNFATEYGYIKQQAMDNILLFPVIDKRDNEFTLTYLHEGKCYITCVIDNNEDMIPSKGDYYSKSQELDVSGTLTLKINDIKMTIE